MVGQDDGFLVFLNRSIESTRLEEFEGLSCLCILQNGFKYKGLVIKVYPDKVLFMDVKTGRHKFNVDKIACMSETPQGRRGRKTRETNGDDNRPKVYLLNDGGIEDGSV